MHPVVLTHTGWEDPFAWELKPTVGIAHIWDRLGILLMNDYDS